MTLALWLVAYLFISYGIGKLYEAKFWEKTVSEAGFFSVYNELFGYPFDYAFEPVLPSGLTQPTLQLPFEVGREWSFTGGPHGGWGDGSAWAALDFAPPGEEVGCIPSDDWVVAVADGHRWMEHRREAPEAGHLLSSPRPHLRTRSRKSVPHSRLRIRELA